MKTLLISASIAILGSAALAEPPNAVTMTFAEFVEANGCVIRDNAAGQSNIYAISGGNCPVDVATLYSGNDGEDDTNGSTVPGL